MKRIIGRGYVDINNTPQECKECRYCVRSKRAGTVICEKFTGNCILVEDALVFPDLNMNEALRIPRNTTRGDALEVARQLAAFRAKWSAVVAEIEQAAKEEK